MIPGVATGVGAGLGGGGGALLGQLSSALSAPRRAVWSALGLPESGAELLAGLGMDPESLLTRGGGTLLEMLGDPLTYAGGLGGALGGRLSGLGRAASAAGDAGQLERAAGLAGTAEGALGGEAAAIAPRGLNLAPSADSPLMRLLSQDLATGPSQVYRAEATAAAPGLEDLARFNIDKAKVYQRVNPDVGQQLGNLGWSQPSGGATGFPMGVPPWAESRGGWLMPTKARAEMLGGGDPTAVPGLLGPRLQGDYLSLLDRDPSLAALEGGPLLNQVNPVEALRRLRAGAGFGNLPELPPRA